MNRLSVNIHLQVFFFFSFWNFFTENNNKKKYFQDLYNGATVPAEANKIVCIFFFLPFWRKNVNFSLMNRIAYGIDCLSFTYTYVSHISQIYHSKFLHFNRNKIISENDFQFLLIVSHSNIVSNRIRYILNEMLF